MPNYDETEEEAIARRVASSKKRKMRSDVRDIRKQKSSALRLAQSAQARRGIKKNAKSLILDIETRYTESKNKQGADERLENDGIDKITGTSPSSSSGGGGGGGGLPDGYVETDVILCVNGSPVSGQFLFKETV